MITISLAKRTVCSFGGAALLMLGQRCQGLEAPRACFRSVAEAVAQNHSVEAAAQGTRTLSGYRLERFQRDAFTHRTWATVSNCEHADWPPSVVAADGVVAAVADRGVGQDADAGTTRIEGARTAGNTIRAAAPMVRAGSVVRIVQQSQNVRMQMQGVAQTNGIAGDRVRVRVIESIAEAGRPERFIAAIVRGADLLEMEP